ncbi:SusC/RagA family TonB-linked outer membrane protein [uncultured Chitinophaga sp.]|uniref:SusC/RagA family TonB-linked outer membrane protein n=1 Tax=uncultured Chitinophaga sp. TaxID=339340 RepID=UPI0025DF3C6F|nr:SusC/RagA family TonB-linked outer membrane protein [uncultured Chitinophaga sp.]
MEKKSTLLMRVALQSFLLMLLSFHVFAQNRQVTGKVTDAKDGSPLPGVTVQIKGTTAGGQTGPDGSFKLEAPPTATTLIFSIIGYENKEVAITGEPLNVKLGASVKALKDVVVIGYGTQKQAEVTSSVATVKPEDFNQGGSRNPLDLVQGKVAGLSITRAGGNNPNGSVSVQLRGASTLVAGLQPLIVIDGVPGGNLDLIQQDDIASFDVLKDGSAAAIYGTRASNGVILITTKRGKAGEPTYSYSTYLQRDAVAQKPNMLSAEQYLKLPGTTDLGGRIKMYDLLLDEDNLSQYHNFSASGGTANSNYRASLYYNDQNGISIQNSRRQYGGRVNVNQTGLQGKLTMQMNVAANLNKANLLGGSAGDFEQAVQRNPTAPIFNEDGSYLETNAFNNYNPLARLTQEISQRDQQTFSGDVKFTLDLYKGLKLSASGAIIRNSWNDRAYRYKDSRSSQVDYNGGGYASKSNQLDFNKTFESVLDYSTTIAEDHSFTALAGYSYQYFTTEGFNVNNNGFLTDAFLDWNLGAGNAITNNALKRPGIGSIKEDNTLVAFFGRLSYSYKQKYLAQVVVRREGSSRFGANHKWGTFPAASVGWVLTKEDFLANNNTINNLKLRLGYGVTGRQDGVANYGSLITLSTGGQYLQDGTWTQTYGPSVNPNPDLKWEQKKEWNLGIDYGFLNNRITGSLDLYNRKTVDLLAQYRAQQPPYIHDQLFTNVGAISNRGIELVVSATPVATKDFTWSTDVTFTYQTGKLESLSNSQFKATYFEYGSLPSPGALGNAIRVEEGQPLGNFYGKRFAGFDSDSSWLFYDKDGNKVGADQITAEDYSVIGNGIPKFLASWSNTVKYKNFDLTLFFRGKFDYQILNLQDLYFGNLKWLPNNVLESAIGKNGGLKDDPQYSDYYLEKGGFVKLDNITLGYNFKLKTKYITNLRLYASGRNVATMTKYSGLDPELEDNGLTTSIDNRGFYPRTRSYTVGLNIGF